VAVSDKGTGQGAVISPLLANIYLHYVLDLWAERWRRREATGDMIIVRYADDIIVGFEHEADARRFLEAMRERLGEFALTLHPDKTRLIEFGPPCSGEPRAARARQAGDLQLPGLHFYLWQVASGQVPPQEENPARPHAGEAASHQTGVAAAQATSRSRSRGKWLRQVVKGYFNYHAVPTNNQALAAFRFFRHRTLATIAQATQSERRHDVAADHAVGQRLAPETGYPSSMAKNTLRRHPPKVGAVCGKAARTVSVRGALSNERPYRDRFARNDDYSSFGSLEEIPRKFHVCQ